MIEINEFNMKRLHLFYLLAAMVLSSSCSDPFQQGLPDCDAVISCGKKVELPPDFNGAFNALFSCSVDWRLDSPTGSDWIDVSHRTGQAGTMDLTFKVLRGFKAQTPEPRTFDVTFIPERGDRINLQTVHIMQRCPYFRWNRDGSDVSNIGSFEWDTKWDPNDPNGYVIRLQSNIKCKMEISGDVEKFRVEPIRISSEGITNEDGVLSPFNWEGWTRIAPIEENTSGDLYKLSISFRPERSGVDIDVVSGLESQSMNAPVTFEQKSK